MSWERFEGSTLRGSDAAHDIAYAEALDEYERETGRAADASWRALLYIGTADVRLVGLDAAAPGL